MVGVPGRSKGCATCKKRRIACTLERPFCFQCAKSGRTCLGYENDRIFVTSVFDPKADGGKWRPDTYKASPPLQQPPAKPKQPPAKQPLSKPLPAKQREVLRHAWDAQAHAAALVPLVAGYHSSLDKAAVKQQVLASFINRFRAPDPEYAHSGHWTSILSAFQPPDSALEFSAFALCTARLGQSRYTGTDEDDGHLSRNSVQLYGKALRALHEAIAKPKTRCDLETLGACWMLTIYEVFECSVKARSGYISHYLGCAHLIHLRGPEAHQTGVSHSIFQSFRLMAALEALLRRKTFLSTPVWMTVPFEKVVKTPLDRLIDLLLQGPELFDRGDVLPYLPTVEAQLTETRALIDLAWSMDNDLQRFYSDLCREYNDQTLYFPAPSSDFYGIIVGESDPDDDIAGLISEEYNFIDIRAGAALVLFWATTCMLASGMCELYKYYEGLVALNAASSSPSSPSTLNSESSTREYDELPPLGERADFLRSARNVYKSVRYCMGDDLGLAFVLGPLNIVVQTLRQWPGVEREVRWGRRAIERVRQQGVGMAAHLPQTEDIEKSGFQRETGVRL